MTKIDVIEGSESNVVFFIGLLVMLVISVAMILTIVVRVDNFLAEVLAFLSGFGTLLASVAILVQVLDHMDSSQGYELMVKALMVNSLTEAEADASVEKVFDLAAGEDLTLHSKVWVVRGQDGVFFVGEHEQD